MAEQNRFFIKAYGPDDDALKIALAWLAAEAKRQQLPAVIVVYQKDQGLALGRVVGEAQAKALTAGQTVKLNDVDLSLVTMLKLGPISLLKKVALAVWLPDKELAKVRSTLGVAERRSPGRRGRPACSCPAPSGGSRRSRP